MKRRDFVKNSGLTAGGLLLYNSLTGATNYRNSKTMKIQNKHEKNICKTCGTRYNQENYHSTECPVCLDDRQYVRNYGQQWVSYSDLAEGYSIKFKKLQENILQLSVAPSFAIGQRAHLISTPEGNILWDCIPFLDDPTVAYIHKLGGIKAIAISHPHYYSLMSEWAKAFDCLIYLHNNDQKWVMDDKDRIKFWSGKKLNIIKNINLIHVGGHFPGSTVLNFTPTTGKSSLFVGDSFYVSLDKKHLSAMFSYPNNIPLSRSQLFRTFQNIEHLRFDQIYGAFDWQNIESGGKELMKNSVKRYQEIYNK